VTSCLPAWCRRLSARGRCRLKTRGHAAGLERISLVGGSSIPTTTKEILSLMGHTPPQRPRANHSVPKLVPLVGCDWPMANDHHTVAHVLRIIPELQQVKPLPPAIWHRFPMLLGHGGQARESHTAPGPKSGGKRYRSWTTRLPIQRWHTMASSAICNTQ